MTPFSDSVFYALSHGSLGFAFHGSNFNYFLIGLNSERAHQNLWNSRLLELQQRTKSAEYHIREHKNLQKNKRWQKWPCKVFGVDYQENKQLCGLTVCTAFMLHLLVAKKWSVLQIKFFFLYKILVFTVKVDWDVVSAKLMCVGAAAAIVFP